MTWNPYGRGAEVFGRMAGFWRRSAAALVPVAAVLLLSEYVHRRASTRELGTQPRRGRSVAVVVLGYRNRGDRANLVNRHRMRVGLRSIPRDADPVTVIVSGGAVGGAHSEAALLAEYARDTLHYTGALVLEEDSRSTWQNIRNVAPLLADVDRIVIASNELHTQKGRVYLRLQHPELAERLVRARDYRFGELILLKPLLAVIGLADLHRRPRGR